MEKRTKTPYGTLEIHNGEALFEATVAKIEEAVRVGKTRTIGLTGGSTPKAFYAWVAENRPFSEDVVRRATWCTSDERMVPLASEDSNFGVADRGMLTPLEVPARRKLPWAVMVDAHSAARSFSMRWEDRFGGNRCFDLCLLGMGEDGHTASLFPGSPLIDTPIADSFTCVEVPGKGWRLTITREGLSRCREILITVTGAKKAAVLKEVLEGKPDVYPVQLLAECRDRVTWFVDSAAAAELDM